MLEKYLQEIGLSESLEKKGLASEVSAGKIVHYEAAPPEEARKNFDAVINRSNANNRR